MGARAQSPAQTWACAARACECSWWGLVPDALPSRGLGGQLPWCTSASLPVDGALHVPRGGVCEWAELRRSSGCHQHRSQHGVLAARVWRHSHVMPGGLDAQHGAAVAMSRRDPLARATGWQKHTPRMTATGRCVRSWAVACSERGWFQGRRACRGVRQV